jgi:hypothetical protein
VEEIAVFQVTVIPWALGWELHVTGVGVTQSAADETDAERMARDFIASELDVPAGSFDVRLG